MTKPLSVNDSQLNLGVETTFESNIPRTIDGGHGNVILNESSQIFS